LLHEWCHRSINVSMAHSRALLVQMHGPTASTLTAQMCGHHPGGGMLGRSWWCRWCAL
jgi:hypothetical protein